METVAQAGLSKEERFCPVCGDLSRCNVLGFWFCANQHKEDGRERQPASRGTNLVGKPWAKTPYGAKKHHRLSHSSSNYAEMSA